MDKLTMKHLKVGDKIVRINTDYDYFGDGSTMQEQWLTIEEINVRRTVYFCRDWEKRMVLFDDKQILSFSTTTLSAYENALERLKKQDVDIAKKIIFCEKMIADLKKENEDEET